AETSSRGRHAGILSSTEPFSESERETMRGLMKDVYDQFLDKALAGRQKAGQKMTREELEKLAGGRIWTGRQAKQNGLVDELGTLADAIASAKEMAGTKEELEILQLPKPRSFLDTLLESRVEERSLPLSEAAALLRDVPGMEKHLKTLDTLLRLKGERVWAFMPYRLEVK